MYECKNIALNQKIWALEAFRGKTVFLGGSQEFWNFFEWLEGFDAKDRGSCGVWEFFWDFGWLRVV
jgi:hypothetical protein